MRTTATNDFDTNYTYTGQMTEEAIGLMFYNARWYDSYHSHLKEWMSRFMGVSTKYLNNYLSWFKWLTINKGVRELDKSHQIFSIAYSVGFKIKWSEFTPITLIVA